MGNSSANIKAGNIPVGVHRAKGRRRTFSDTDFCRTHLQFLLKHSPGFAPEVLNVCFRDVTRSLEG